MNGLLENLRCIGAAHDALLAARKAAECAWGAGLDGIDAAIAEQVGAIHDVVDRAAEVDWVHFSELPVPIDLLAEATRLVGMTEPVARFGVRVSTYCKAALPPTPR